LLSILSLTNTVPTSRPLPRRATSTATTELVQVPLGCRAAAQRAGEAAGPAPAGRDAPPAGRVAGRGLVRADPARRPGHADRVAAPARAGHRESASPVALHEQLTVNPGGIAITVVLGVSLQAGSAGRSA